MVSKLLWRKILQPRVAFLRELASLSKPLAAFDVDVALPFRRRGEEKLHSGIRHDRRGEIEARGRLQIRETLVGENGVDSERASILKNALQVLPCDALQLIDHEDYVSRVIGIRPFPILGCYAEVVGRTSQVFTT